MKKLLRIIPIVTLAVSLGLCGCKTSKLEAGGTYTTTITNVVNGSSVVLTTSDLPLYTADAAFGFAYKTLDAAFLIERNNREYLWNISPAIKHTLDQVRVTASQVVDDYLAARAAYISNPTPAGLTGVNAVLAKIQQLMSAAYAAIGEGTVTTNAIPKPQ
jgi:hypothetical protein